MTPEIEKQETEHEKLVRLSRSLTGPRDGDVCDDLGLRRDESRAAFVQSVRLSTCETGALEGECGLQWIDRMRPLSREQRDNLTCQRAREDVRVMVRENRQQHVRFQELLGVAEEFATELETNPTLRIRLNPIRVWRQFETRVLLGEDSETPSEVLFYPVVNSIQAAVLKPIALERIQPLCQFGSCTIVEWLYECDRLGGSPRPDRVALIALSRELMKYHLIAFA